MNATERKELLRALAKVHPITGAYRAAGIARAAGKCGERPKRVRYVVLPKPTGRGFVSCGPALAIKPPLWVKTGDERQKPMVELKRRQGAPVLAKVAEKAKRTKLPRLKLREPWQRTKVTP